LGINVSELVLSDTNPALLAAFYASQGTGVIYFVEESL
jgi:hypothetical protein